MIKKLFRSSFIIIFIYTCVALVFLTYVQASKLKSYENGNGELKNVKIITKYNDSIVKIEDKNNNNLNNFIKCYQRKEDTSNFSFDLKNKINEIQNYFSNSNSMASFSYEDLYSGFYMSFNENREYFTASTIKSPVVTYIYDLYANNQINLNEYMIYDYAYYLEGSGNIQYQPVGTSYTLQELMDKSITISDNIAYQMLATRVYNTDIINYWRNLGATTFWSQSMWGVSTTKDNVIYMKQLYNLNRKYPEKTIDLMNYHFNSIANFINLPNKDIKIAHKSGWNYANVHDMAIIYNKQPYVLAINTLKGFEDYTSFYNKATELINSFHELYWKEKADICYNESFNY